MPKTPPAKIDCRKLRKYIEEQGKLLEALENMEVHVNPVYYNVSVAGGVIAIPCCPTGGHIEFSGSKATLVIG